MGRKMEATTRSNDSNELRNTKAYNKQLIELRLKELNLKENTTLCN
jgi:hypothetical protein